MAARLWAWDYAGLLCNLYRDAGPKSCHYSQNCRAQSPLNHFYTWCTMLVAGLQPVVNIPLLLPSNKLVAIIIISCCFQQLMMNTNILHIDIWLHQYAEYFYSNRYIYMQNLLNNALKFFFAHFFRVFLCKLCWNFNLLYSVEYGAIEFS